MQPGSGQASSSSCRWVTARQVAPPRQRQRQRMRGVHRRCDVQPTSSRPSTGSRSTRSMMPSRGGACPLQVVDEQHHRSFAATRPPATRPPRCAGPQPARSADHPSRAARPAEPRTPADRGRQDPRSAPSDVKHPLAQLGQLIVRLGQQEPPERAKGLKYAPSNSRSRRYWSNLPATNQPSLPVTNGRKWSINAVLPTPGGAADQDAAALAPERVIERFLQCRHLRPPVR